MSQNGQNNKCPRSSQNKIIIHFAVVRPTRSTKMRTRTHLSSGGKDSRLSYQTP